MKKISSIIASVLALGAFTATGIAASACGGHGNRGHHSYAGATAPAVSSYSTARHYFIDSNGDGICDNCGSSVCLTNGLCGGYHNHGYFVDNNNDGICDNCGSEVCLPNGLCGGNRRGNFVDSNGDGICDNCAGGVCSQHGTGIGYHHGYGGFTDVNGDGICDNYGSGGRGNFIDSNNEGICDNYANGSCPQNVTGINYRRGRGCHR